MLKKEQAMIGMSFTSFVILLVLGFIAALVLHELLRYRVLSGVDGFVRMWLAGWIGGWLGSPVLGHWSFQMKDVYIIPALVGAFAGAFAAVATIKALAATTTTLRQGAMAPKENAAGLEMRKAS